MLRIFDRKGRVAESYKPDTVQALIAYAEVMSGYSHVAHCVQYHYPHGEGLRALIVTMNNGDCFTFTHEEEDCWIAT